MRKFETGIRRRFAAPVQSGLAVVAGATILWASFGAVPASAGQGEPPALGTYRLDNGVCVSGGMMNEGGRPRLLFMDLWTNRLGGLFEAGDGHVSALGDGAHLTFETGNPERLTWTTGEGHTYAGALISSGDERPAEFNNGDVVLRGALFLPKERPGRVPAVILAHGSGQVDRYAGPWVTFFVDLGFAVLSYDKRGVGASSGNWRKSSFGDLSGDLTAAVGWVSAQPEIDRDRIGIATSSQSGWYGPAAVAANPEVDFLIQRAGPGTPIAATTRHELTNDWRKDGVADGLIEPAATFWTLLHERLTAGAGFTEAEALVADAREQPWFDPTFGDWRIRPQWWEQRRIDSGFDPAEDAGGLNVPVLWFLATNDENVPFDLSLAALREAQTRNPRLEVVTLEGADHAFLIQDQDGVRFTSEYWPVMKRWLIANGLTGPLPAWQADCGNG